MFFDSLSVTSVSGRRKAMVSRSVFRCGQTTVGISSSLVSWDASSKHGEFVFCGGVHRIVRLNIREGI